MSFAKPAFLWLVLLVVPDLLITFLRASGFRASIEALAGPRSREGASARFSTATLCGAVASALFIASTALALASPSWGRSGRAADRRGLEAAVVLDVSRSMLAADLAPTRLDAAKGILRSLLRALPDSPGSEDGVAFSLVAAKGDALLLVPMTEDVEAFDQALEYALPEVMTAKGTDLGKGIEAGLASFGSYGAASRLVILFSDGGDLSGSARKAAEKARAAKARLLVIGLGGNVPAFVPGPSRPGQPVADGEARAALDERGQPALSALDSALLRGLAAAGGGRYLEGVDSSTIAALAAELSQARAGGTRIEYETEDRTGLFAALALAFLVCRIAAELVATARAAARDHAGAKA